MSRCIASYLSKGWW